MAALERGLGRGLDSLLRSTREADIPSRDAKKLALTQLTPGRHQPRKHFDDAALADLATSIKNQGIVQPLIVRPLADSSPQMYEIVAGERRWRAARLAGLTEVPVVVASYTDAEAMTVALVENLQRENLSPLEEAEALQTLRDTHKLSQEELAAKLGKSRSAVANSLRLLQLPQNCREALAGAIISAGHARTLLSIGDEEIRDRLLNGIIQRDLSVRDAESIADYWKRTGRLPAPLDEDSPGAAAVEKETRHRTPKPQRLKDIQILLRKTVHHGASISGNEEKGRIALPYSSSGELESLLRLLGMDGERQDVRETGESVPPGDGISFEAEVSAPMDGGVVYEPEGVAGAAEVASFESEEFAAADGCAAFEAEEPAPVSDIVSEAEKSTPAAEAVSPEVAASAPTDDSAAFEVEEFAPTDEVVNSGEEPALAEEASPGDDSVGFEAEYSAPVHDIPRPDAEEFTPAAEAVSPEVAESVPANDSAAFEIEEFAPTDEVVNSGGEPALSEEASPGDDSVGFEAEYSAPVHDIPRPEADESMPAPETVSPGVAESVPADDSAAFEIEEFAPADEVVNSGEEPALSGEASPGDDSVDFEAEYSAPVHDIPRPETEESTPAAEAVSPEVAESAPTHDSAGSAETIHA